MIIVNLWKVMDAVLKAEQDICSDNSSIKLFGPLMEAKGDVKITAKEISKRIENIPTISTDSATLKELLQFIKSEDEEYYE